MKKIICIMLCILCICTCFTACNENSQDEVAYKTYQKLSYTDFNNLAMEKGYSPIENTDNIKFKFKKSFSISDNDSLSILFYELETYEDALSYYTYLLQSYEVYTSEFSKHEKFEKYGYYMLKDGRVTTYFSFVENTLIYAMIYTDDAVKQESKRTELVNFINYIQYPIEQYPVFN